MGYNNLQNYYRVNFSLTKHHNYGLSEIENMMPYERDFFIDMIVEYLNKLEQDLENQQNNS